MGRFFTSCGVAARRRYSGLFSLLIGFFLLGGLVHRATAVEAAIPPGKSPAVPMDQRTHDLLSATIQFYAGLRSFEVDIASTTHMEMTGMKTDMDSSFHAALQRPNSFAILMKAGLGGGSVISDGKTWITYLSTLNKYTSVDAPALSDLVQPMNLVLVEGGLPIGLESLLLGPKALESLGAGLKKSEYVGLEKVGAMSAQHLRLTSKVYIIDLWIADGPQPLLRQCDVSPDLSAALEKMPAGQRMKMPAGFGSLKMTRSSVYSNWRLNQPVAATTFQFQPPLGATLVDAFYTPPPHPLVGKMAPDFQLNDLGGHPVKLSALRGKVVVLDFWATWCGPCGASLPIVAEVTSSFRDRGVVFYAANLRETAAQINQFQKSKNLFFPVLLDSQGAVSGLYLAKAIPESVLIDGTGRIQAVHVGYDPGLKRKLTQQLTDLLGGRQLTAAPAPAAK